MMEGSSGLQHLGLKIVAAGTMLTLLMVVLLLQTGIIAFDGQGTSTASLSASFASSRNDKNCSPAKLPPDVAGALIHYATSSVTPQQNPSEIALSRRVLEARSPCNFLVFGLGHDSLMWATLNRGGRTVFLEEDSKWIAEIGRRNPQLKAFHVKYPTQLKEADALLSQAAALPACRGAVGETLDTSACRLALNRSILAAEVVDTEWDVVMVDAPRGYFPEAPGRMTAIYSAAVMARARRGPGVTDIFVHDVDRPVEKKFCLAFLCKAFRVGAAGRIWHFRVPAATSDGFCPR